MNNKFLIYSLVGLLSSGAIGGIVLSNSKQAQSLPASGNAQQSRSVRVDRHFIEMMIPHHQDAIVMADLALSRGRRPEIKKIAASIKQAQTREITEMRTWYKQWFGTEVPNHSMTDMGMMGDHHNQGQKKGSGMGTGSGSGMGQGMGQGMMDMKMDIDALKTAKDFDKEFVRQMIPHHQMAVKMAQMASGRATHSEIRTLAESIIKSQNAEIAKMQGWQQAWH
ncbi:DUF305 domain-containing protein [Chamaesiphon minutus]|uniref:DUF305 domain-containing protein n=1 Tax=Chamaesiphon minutus (strain ATCC 27169 / PCC 6605) TaxID=1173020 RepID=K9UR49_CHAP6|nr:DUF305 domain-containing protein [Chamaesiphon minutus]AFY96926.1 hypothetical protein Cha6605_6090 [Chamaesiphon minutus PCC 6605]